VTKPKHEIGQLLWVLERETRRVAPFRIVEQLIRKSIDGEEVSYVLDGGPNIGKVDLEDVKGEVFDSQLAARDALVQRAQKAIDALVSRAAHDARQWFGTDVSTLPAASQGKKTRKQQRAVQQDDDNEVGFVGSDGPQKEDEGFITLPDGTRARVKSVKLPEVLE